MKYEGIIPESRFEQEVEDSPGASLVGLSKTQAEKERKWQAKATIRVEHIGLIKDDFWDQRPWLLSGKAARTNTKS